MRKNVSVNDLDLAIAWLRCNEGAYGSDEQEACKRVADMLEKLADKREAKKVR